MCDTGSEQCLRLLSVLFSFFSFVYFILSHRFLSLVSCIKAIRVHRRIPQLE